MCTILINQALGGLTTVVVLTVLLFYNSIHLNSYN